MRCPLCSGPLHLDATKFVCEREHELSGPELEAAATTRASIAMWMAIEALETEAEALRLLASTGQSLASEELAARAEKDALMLRTLTTAHSEGAESSLGS
jgi:hypothetical protein